MQKKHTMNRHLVESIVCSACETEQPPVANCGSCGTPSPRSKLASMQHAAASVWPRHSLGACSLTHTFTACTLQANVSVPIFVLSATCTTMT